MFWLTRCKDGTILLGVIAGKEHAQRGCPAIYRSTDNGKTFGEIQILKQFGPGKDYPHCGNIALGIADDGAAVLLAMAFELGKRNTIFGWRSADSGKTWQPIDTSALADNKTGSTYGTMVSVPQLGLVAFGHYRQASKPSQGIWMSVSKDHGCTWGAPKQIVKEKEYEPSFTFSKGRLVGLLRPDTRCYDQAVSDDLGKTWKFQRHVIGLPKGEKHSSVPCPFITTAPNDPSKLYALRSERGRHNGSSGRVYLMAADIDTLGPPNREIIELVGQLPLDEEPTTDDNSVVQENSGAWINAATRLDPKRLLEQVKMPDRPQPRLHLQRRRDRPAAGRAGGGADVG